MLLNNEGEDLGYDDLEGIDESRIFKEVFFGYDHHTNSNRGLNSGTTNKCELLKNKENYHFSNGGSSAITTQLKSCYAKEDLRENSATRCSSGGDALFLRSDHDGNDRCMNLPTDELSCSENYSVGSLNTSGPSKRILSGISLPAQAVVNGFVTYRLVESSSQGIASSCFSTRLPAKNDVREVDASKTICSPISQENSGNKLFVAVPIVNAANNTLSHQSSKKTMKPSEVCKVPPSKAVLICDSMSNVKSFLRYHIQDLLRDSGWEIGRRKRETNIGEFLYYSPWRWKPIRQLRRVWNLCGRKLFTDAKIVLQEDNKEWADMAHLCSDLSNTVMKIEIEMSGKKTAAALAQRWYLLDPFVNMVFMDKKLNTLKAGKSVKARRSLVMGAFGENDVLLQSDYAQIYGKRLKEESEDQPSDTSVVNESALTVYDTKEEGAWCGASSANKRSRHSTTFSRDCGAHGDYEYLDNCLFEVPISFEDADIICRESATEHPGQYCDKFSKSFGRHRSNDDADFDLKVRENKAAVSYETDQSFNMQVNENVEYQVDSSYLVDADIKVMVPKSYELELFDTKKDNIQLKQTGVEGCCIATNEHINERCRKSLMNYSCWSMGTKQDVKLEKFDSQNEKRHVLRTYHLKDDDRCFSATKKSKSFRSSTKKYGCEINSFKAEAWNQHKNKNGHCRLVPRCQIKEKKHNEGESSMLNVRTVLSWLVYHGVISLGDTIQCRSKMDDTVVKYGFVSRDGILCECCSMLLSISKFRTHAGCSLNHPCLDLYMKCGKSLKICQVEAWSAEYKARESATRPVNEYMDQNDDKCGLCGDMGELICCDNCPSTFHQACLETQELPEGSWYCMHCSCRLCGYLVNDEVPLKSDGALMCLQCEHKYHRACLEEKGYRRVPSDESFCFQSCQEVYGGLNSRIGLVYHLSDGFSWTLLKCIHGDQRIYLAPEVVALEAECNSKLAVALSIMEECFLSIVDSRTGIDLIPHVLFNWRSEYPRLNYHGFYTAVLEKDDVLLSVASIRIHGVTVAEMPLVATCSEYQRQGMFRRLLHTIEKLLKSLKVEKLVVSALPSLVETWTIGFGFTQMEDDERKSLRDFNLMVFPGTVWLKKNIYGSPKTLQGHRSSSITDSRTETTSLRKRPIIESQKHTLVRSSANEAANKMDMRPMNSKNLLTDQEQRHGSLYRHLLKLPWGEPDSSVGRIRVDVRAARENVLRMSQQAHTSHDIC